MQPPTGGIADNHSPISHEGLAVCRIERRDVIPKTCKRLAEVDFPVAVVSKHAAREKSIRHGHPSTLHLWWARRPLASSRAVLLALLLPDPCDRHCPEDFLRVAADELRGLAEHLVKTKAGSELLIADLKSNLKSKRPGIREEAEREAERRARVWNDLSSEKEPWPLIRVRRALLHLLAQGAAWEWSVADPFLNVSRKLVKAAHGEHAPLVVDPFAGGGSIPLEALRMGCEAFASDLNPVACLILKAMLEDIPRRGSALADELRRVGGEIKAVAEKELSDLYPPDPDGATPIAYLWARTVRCEAPNCGAEIPLIRSMWLCKKLRRKRALRLSVQRDEVESPRVEFEIFEPSADKDVRAGTVARAKAACVCCGSVLPPERVRAQLAAQRGGADVIFDEQGCRSGGAFLLAVVTLKPGEKGRHYRLPTVRDYAAVRRARDRVARIIDDWERRGRKGPCPVPDEPISLNEVRRISVPIYGMHTWGDLFTLRQKAALVELCRLVRRHDSSAPSALLLALSVSRFADIANSLCQWENTKHQVRHLFTRQSVPMLWDFAEASFVGGQAGDHATTLRTMARVVERFSESREPTQVHGADAAAHPLPDQAANVWFTDPPYYDAVPYAHLADFFFVWLRRIIPDDPLLRNSFESSSCTTPKVREIVVDRPHRMSTSEKDAESYEQGMARAFAEGRRVLRDDGIGSVVFAHKTTEGWEALLSGMIKGGWTLTGSWPIATEMDTRPNARETASLATSVHLICRPRPDNALVGDWAVVLHELPRRVGEWMERLQGEGIRGADLVFACIGPALEIFSRYERVETADGHEIGLPKYLEKVWEVVGRTALENVLGAAEAQARNGLAGALEEDARLTALFLWTLQATNGETGRDVGGRPVDVADDEGVVSGGSTSYSLVFDVVRRFAQPLGIDLPRWENHTIETEKGMVRLIPVAERAERLFGERGAAAVAAWLEQEVNSGADVLQGVLFPDYEEAPTIGRVHKSGVGETAEVSAVKPGATTLDRVHTGMLLQAGGQTSALRALVKAERERGPDFLRLSNALSALYPAGSEEKRLLDAMLLTLPK